MTPTTNSPNYTALSKRARIAQLHANVPAELRERRQWVCWNTDKAPCSARTGQAASVTDPRNFGTFEQAISGMQAHRHLEGVGFVFTDGDPFVGADLDRCIDADGTISGDQQAIIDLLDTYTERSQSGSGIHVVAKGTLPVGGRKVGNLEVYQSGRFFALTGDIIEERRVINERQDELAQLYEQAFGTDEAEEVEQAWRVSPPLGDDDILRLAFDASNGAAIRKLVAGSSEGYPSTSEADLALLGYLKFYTQDPEQLARLFKRSGLYQPDNRKRGDRYIARTIAKALATITETYGGHAVVYEPVRIIRGGPYSAGDLMHQEFPEPRWAVPGLLPEGLSALAGKPKMGKSWMALDIALGIAAAAPVLGSVEVEQGDVLGLFLEDNPRRLQSRLTKLLTSGSGASVRIEDGTIRLNFGRALDPSRLVLAHQWPRLDQGGLEQLDQWISEHPEARLIVVDTLARIKPRVGRGSAYEEDAAALGPLQDLALHRGISVLVLTHLRKQAIDDPLESINASMGFAGTLDGALILSRIRGRADATLYVTGRDIEDDGEVALSWDADTARWSLSGDAATARLTAERAEVLEAIRRAGDWISARVIGDTIGKAVQAVRYLGDKLVAEGFVESSRRGYRAVAETPTEPTA